ncbi:MAG: hypothetical protein HZA46_24450 [Planctomycetales bacterium]|nr:hypothetical protein [Planctomycetales bacterium]
MDYQLKLRSRKCAGTGQELVPGSICHSVVVERNGELLRLDYSEQGWPGPPPGAVGVWKGIVPRPVEVKNAPLDTHALMSYFEQLNEEASPATEKLRYILSLLLLQKKRLRLDGERQDGEIEYWQFAGVKGEGAYEVRAFQLSDAEMDELQRDLSAHLAREWGS